MAIKLTIILVFVISLLGCSILEPRVEYRDKLVPVYTVPEPPKIERPELPIHGPRYGNLLFLSNPDNIGQIAQDYAVSLRLALNYSTAQEEIIETYRRLSQQDFSERLFPIRSIGNVQLFSGAMSNDSKEAEVIYSQAQFETYARFSFEDIVDKYEERKKEILKDETE